MEQHLHKFTVNTVLPASLSQEWWGKFDYLISRDIYSALSTSGKNLHSEVNRGTRTVYIHSDIVQEVEKRYDARSKALKWNSKVIASGAEELSAGELWDV